MKQDDTIPPAAHEAPRSAGSARPRGIFVACGTAFIASAAVMTVEMLAFRIIARFLGNSQYTTASIIGVVLGGLAVGNYVGGRLADRHRPRPTLAALFILASAGCACIPLFNAQVGQWSVLWEWSWPARCAAHVALTFLIPCGLLGTIGPVVAKMALDAGDRVGRTIGGIYAWGVVGSIVGTFATSFYLIPHFGIQALTYACAGVLALMGLLFAVRRGPASAWAGALALAVLLIYGPWPAARAFAAEVGLREEEGPDIFFDRASEYSQVCVKQYRRDEPKRVMLLDKLAHSFWNPDDPNQILYGYERVFDAVTEQAAPGRTDLRALILGGGGYTHPRYFLRHRPEGRLEVVEIDPVVTQAAMEAFGLKPDERMHIVHLDARQHVADLVRRRRAGEAVAPFDFIYLDAVNDYNVPSHLTTAEFQLMVRELLAPDGVYLMNVIDILDVGEFLAAMIETTRRTFPHVVCFFANEGDIGAGLMAAERNTFVIVASSRELGLERLGGSPERDDVRRLLLPRAMIDELLVRVRPRVLTDDLAPVEYLLAPVVEQSERRSVPARFYNRANRLESGGQTAAAAQEYRRAIELNQPYYKAGLNTTVHFFAHLNLGLLRFGQGRAEEAACLFDEMTRLFPQEPESWHNLGSVRYATGDYAGAAAAYRQALDRKPTAARWDALGLALGRLGRLAESRAAFDEALALEPGYAEARTHKAEIDRAMAATRPASRSQ